MSTQPTQLHIEVVSDLHVFRTLYSVERCDVLLVAGDYSRGHEGDREVVKPFAEWLQKQPAQTKIVIFGNGEGRMQREYPESAAWITDICPDAIVLKNEFYDVGPFVVYGSQYPFRGPQSIPEEYGSKPLVVLAHQPPHGIMDLMVVSKKALKWEYYHGGSKKLLNFCKNVKPALVCFGHCHNCHGVMEEDGTIYVNASCITERSIPCRNPIAIYYDGERFNCNVRSNGCVIS